MGQSQAHQALSLKVKRMYWLTACEYVPIHIYSIHILTYSFVTIHGLERLFYNLHTV